VLLLGLGNDILTDDAIGLHVVRQVQHEVGDHPWLDIRETTEMGLALLDLITGCSAVLIVDSIQTGKAAPGAVHELEPSALSHIRGRTPHFLGVGETLDLGRQLGLPMPKQVKILAIEVEDALTLGTEMSPTLQAAVLRGKLRVKEEMLFIEEERVRHLELMVDSVAFTYREMESCVRTD
jgi:hydrogenase maturation protease